MSLTLTVWTVGQAPLQRLAPGAHWWNRRRLCRGCAFRCGVPERHRSDRRGAPGGHSVVVLQRRRVGLARPSRSICLAMSSKRFPLLAGTQTVNIARFYRSPFRIQPSLGQVVVKARPWPFRQARDVPMLDGVEVDVVDVASVVVDVANPMLPKPPLPDGRFASRPLRGRWETLRTPPPPILAREVPLQPGPPRRVILVVFGE